MSSPVPCSTNANDNGHRKRSVARSFSSELGTVDEEEVMNANSLFESSSREQTTQAQTDAQLSYSSGDPMERIQTTVCPREVMKTKIRYHFMNPLQKFRARRRKPWKLVLQIVKIVLVTLQICLFGFDRFSLVTFLENNQTALKHLFLKDYQNGQKGVIVYTREQLYDNIHYALDQYYNITTVPLGTYDYDYHYKQEVNGSKPPPPPLLLCYSYYAAGGIENNTFLFNPDVEQVCQLKEEHMEIENDTFNLGRLREVRMTFFLKTVNLKSVKAWDKPACYQLGVTILFDNVKYDGRMPVQLHMNNTWLDCQSGEIKGSDPFRAHIISLALVVFDAVVIFICTVSLVLCGRSIYKSLKLAKEAAKFFNEDPILGDFTFSDYQEFVSLWFFVIMTSDSLTIIGSIYKMSIDQKDSDFYNVSSIFLGTAVLLVWIGLLRFLGYFKQYNIILVTLKAATPSMARFFVCVSLLFAGFMFCGWIVLGPFHPKFKTLTVTAECLYSMVNGDDLFNTYALITSKAPGLVLIFSKVYIYIFIGLFIYVVLSLFIGIIGDTYERLKDMGHLPETKIQRFLHEPANFGRSVQRTGRTTAEDIPIARPRERADPFAGSHSSGTQDPMMRRVSIDSTGAE